MPTYHDGGRCDDPRFRAYDALAGTWHGEGTRLDFFPILDGCAVIGFLENEAGPNELLLLTFDTFAERWVTAVLDDDPESGLVVYEGKNRWASFASDDAGALSWDLDGPGDRLHYRRGERKLELERVERGGRDPS